MNSRERLGEEVDTEPVKDCIEMYILMGYLIEIPLIFLYFRNGKFSN